MPTFKDRRGRLHIRTTGSRHADGRPGETRVDGPPSKPARNASRDAWVAYARTVAQTSDEADAIDGLSRDELVEVFADRDPAAGDGTSDESG